MFVLKLKKGALYCFVAILCSCSLADEFALQHEIREHVKIGHTDIALNLAQSDKFYTDKASSFVADIDKGMLHYMKGNYYQALQHFDKASERNKELFTVSISNVLASQIVGESVANYSGERYEVSMIRFYQSLCHYHLAQKGVYEAHRKLDEDDKWVAVSEKHLSDEEKRVHANAARASVVDWNGLLTTYSSEQAGKPTYKQDLLAKVWGGFIHENHATSADKQISKQLYRDISKYLMRNYGFYPAFNEKTQDYIDDYEKLPRLSEKVVRKKYIKDTNFAKALKKAGSDMEKSLKGKKNNVRVFLQTGLIGEKVENLTEIDLTPVALAGVFTQDPAFITMMMSSPKVEISIPEIKCKPVDKTYKLIIKNKKGKTVLEKPMILVNPLTEIACHEYRQNLPALIKAKTARMLTKYGTALATAYAVYKSINDPSWAQISAALTFSLQIKAINASEKADLRYGALLPDNIWFQAFPLKKGKFAYELKEGENVVHTGDFTVSSKGFSLLDIVLPAQ